MRKRSHVVSMHLNGRELQHLNRQAQLSGLRREEYLRSLILGAELRPRPCTHHAELVRKVSGLCNNANQLAHQANAVGHAGQHSVEEMMRLARQIQRDVRELW